MAQIEENQRNEAAKLREDFQKENEYQQQLHNAKIRELQLQHENTEAKTEAERQQLRLDFEEDGA